MARKRKLPVVLSKEEQNALILSHLQLPKIVATKYISLVKSGIIEFEELVSFGNEGLVEGASRCNPEKGNPRAYLKTWVKAYILRGLYANRTVRAPSNRIDDVIGLEKEIKALEHQVYGSCDRSNIDELHELKAELVQAKIRVGDRVKNSAEDTHDYNDLIDYACYHSDVYPESTVDADIRIRESEQEVNRLMDEASLTAFENEVITHRFGLKGTEPKKLREIAEKYRYTIMGIKKVEDRALAKMRKVANAHH